MRLAFLPGGTTVAAGHARRSRVWQFQLPDLSALSLENDVGICIRIVGQRSSGRHLDFRATSQRELRPFIGSGTVSPEIGGAFVVDNEVPGRIVGERRKPA